MRHWSFLNIHLSLRNLSNLDSNEVFHTSKVKENTKSHHAKALGSSEISVGGSHIFVLPRLLVEDLDVGRDISISPFLGVVVEHLIRNF